VRGERDSGLVPHAPGRLALNGNHPRRGGGRTLCPRASTWEEGITVKERGKEDQQLDCKEA